MQNHAKSCTAFYKYLFKETLFYIIQVMLTENHEHNSMRKTVPFPISEDFTKIRP